MSFQQRQASPPVVVRHVFTTSGQGIPVTMAVLPQGSALSPEVSKKIRNKLAYHILDLQDDKILGGWLLMLSILIDLSFTCRLSISQLFPVIDC